MIRLRTASLVNLNPFVEFGRLKMANHVGVIVQHSGKFWIAEMVATGLKINSLNDYLRKGSRDKIVSSGGFTILILPKTGSQQINY